MKISAQIRWTLGHVEFDPRLVTLLEAIARHGTLQQAAASSGVSYRHAWGLLDDAGSQLGRPLVVRQQGRGTVLAPTGTKVLEAMLEINGTLAADLRRGENRMEELLKQADREPSPSGSHGAVKLHVSHDLALAQLRELQGRIEGLPPIDMQFHGSLDCLAALRRKQCDLAGFHLPAIPGTRTLAAQFLPFLSLKGWRAAHLLDRTQGLMVAAGNPKSLHKLIDLSRKTVRFVNRQPGSGTRLCLDFLLSQNGVSPADIHGYTHEEFTHGAVAATVASGMADAGFGIEAAAREHQLDFVPIVNEHYYLAARNVVLQRPTLRGLLKFLDSKVFRRLVNELAGYRSVAALKWVNSRDIVE